MARIVKVDPVNPDKRVLEEAAHVLRLGGLVAFPTETVYGLGCDAFNGDAATKVFEAKGRPRDNPLIIHLSSTDQLNQVASDVPDEAYGLVKKFWPGPLTLILRKSPNVPPEVTGGRDTVAVRMPAHPVALGLIDELGRPIAAPSANKAGRPSPTKADHVVEDFGGSPMVDLILDGGPTFFGIESTIVDLTKDPPVLVRPGPYSVDEISAALGKEIEVPGFARGLGEAVEAIAPGAKYRHYAPDTPLMLVECNNETGLAFAIEAVARELMGKGLKVAVLATEELARRLEGLGIKVIIMGSRSNLYTVAKSLFDSLRLLDKSGVDVGIVEGLYEAGIGLAIMNRVRKASGGRIINCRQ